MRRAWDGRSKRGEEASSTDSGAPPRRFADSSRKSFAAKPSIAALSSSPGFPVPRPANTSRDGSASPEVPDCRLDWKGASESNQL